MRRRFLDRRAWAVAASVCLAACGASGSVPGSRNHQPSPTLEAGRRVILQVHYAAQSAGDAKISYAGPPNASRNITHATPWEMQFDAPSGSSISLKATAVSAGGGAGMCGLGGARGLCETAR